MGRALNNQLDKELPYGQANVRLNQRHLLKQRK